MKSIIFSGFGGQGILTLGQIVATMALNKGMEVTWMPSYGAEMRGGTANCSVIISDKVIGSPMVDSDADILCAMNQPSVNKFLPLVKPGGEVLINSSLIKEKIERDDVKVVKIDAVGIAAEVGSAKVQNMVMLAGFINNGLFTIDDVQQVIEEKFGKKNPKLMPLNISAIEKGFERMVNNQ